MRAPYHILLIKHGHRLITALRQSLFHAGLRADIVHLHDGISARDFLKELELGADPWIPDLVLLELDLPRLGGIDILREIRRGLLWQQVAVVLLGDRPPEECRQTLEKLGAEMYWPLPQKSEDFDALVDGIGMLVRHAS